QAGLLHCPRCPRQQPLRHGDPRHHPAEFQGQAVERRLEQLWVLPSGRAFRSRHLDFRYWAAPDETAGRHVQQVNQRVGSGSAQLECYTRQQHRLQQQLPWRAGRLRLRERYHGPWAMFRYGKHDTPNPAIYDHGITQGGSDALDTQTLWIFAAVRALNQPRPGNLAAGAAVFQANCASCHGGVKWTKSEIFHPDNPAAIAQNMAPLDPGVTTLRAALPVTGLANEFFSFTCNNLTIKYLEKVGTFDPSNTLEIRDNPAASTAFGVNGFNVPSLLSINYHAPYLHRGQAQTLEDVFP